MARHVTETYTSRAEEYTSLLGSMDSAHPEDRDLVDRWAKCCNGIVVDAGCVPGHWTDHLAGLGIPSVGIDADIDRTPRSVLCATDRTLLTSVSESVERIGEVSECEVDLDVDGRGFRGHARSVALDHGRQPGVTRPVS